MMEEIPTKLSLGDVIRKDLAAKKEREEFVIQRIVPLLRGGRLEDAIEMLRFAENYLRKKAVV